MGLAEIIVNMPFGLTIGGVAVAMAPAFGLDGRDSTKAITDSWVTMIIENKAASCPRVSRPAGMIQRY